MDLQTQGWQAREKAGPAGKLSAVDARRRYSDNVAWIEGWDKAAQELFDQPVSPARLFIKQGVFCIGTANSSLSWPREDALRRGLLSEAARLQMRFDPVDIVFIARLGLVDVDKIPWHEGYYAAACGFDHYYRRTPANVSAARAWELYLDRPPFILKTRGHKSGYRLVVGSWLVWQGRRVKLTSFDRDKKSGAHYARVCTYADPEEATYCETCGHRVYSGKYSSPNHALTVTKLYHTELMEHNRELMVALAARKK